MNNIKINHWRDPQGKFAKRKRVIANRITLALIITVFAFITAWQYFNPLDQQTNHVVSRYQSTAIDTIKDRENFKKLVDNQATQILLTEKIADRQAKIEALKIEIQTTENELATVRKESLLFQ